MSRRGRGNPPAPPTTRKPLRAPRQYREVTMKMGGSPFDIPGAADATEKLAVIFNHNRDAVKEVVEALSKVLGQAEARLGADRREDLATLLCDIAGSIVGAMAVRGYTPAGAVALGIVSANVVAQIEAADEAEEEPPPGATQPPGSA